MAISSGESAGAGARPPARTRTGARPDERERKTSDAGEVSLAHDASQVRAGGATAPAGAPMSQGDPAHERGTVWLHAVVLGGRAVLRPYVRELAQNVVLIDEQHARRMHEAANENVVDGRSFVPKR